MHTLFESSLVFLDSNIAHAVISYTKSLEANCSPEPVPKIVITPPDDDVFGETLLKAFARFMDSISAYD